MSVEYYPARVGTQFFKLTKFVDGSTEPDNVYFVTLKRKGEKGFVASEPDPQMHCDCPNRRRGKHVNDKHGVMIAQWILKDFPQGYFDENYQFHDTGYLSENPFDSEAANDPDADDDESGEEHP